MGEKVDYIILEMIMDQWRCVHHPVANPKSKKVTGWEGSAKQSNWSSFVLPAGLNLIALLISCLCC